VILFRPLGREELRAIVGLQLARVQALAVDLGVALEVSPEAVALISEAGYDPAYGARPLKRAIQRLVQDPLALQLLESEIPAGARIRAVPDPDGRGLAFLQMDADGPAPVEADA